MPNYIKLALLSSLVPAIVAADDLPHRHFQDRNLVADGGATITADLDARLDGNEWLVALHCDVENRLFFAGVRGSCTATLIDDHGDMLSSLRSDVEENPAAGLAGRTFRGHQVELRIPAYRDDIVHHDGDTIVVRRLVDIRSVRFSEYTR